MCFRLFLIIPLHFRFLLSVQNVIQNFSFIVIGTNWTPGRRGGLVVERRVGPGARGRGFDPRSCRRVVSLSEIYLPPKSTGNTQEAIALSRHD